MPTPYTIIKDYTGTPGRGLPFTELNYTATLAAATDTTLTIPTTPTGTQYLAVISVTDGKEVWAALDINANIPSGADFAQTSSVQITQDFQRVVKGGDFITFYTSGSGVSVTVSLYPLTPM